MSDCPRAPRELRSPDDPPADIESNFEARAYAAAAALENTDEEIPRALSALALATTLIHRFLGVQPTNPVPGPIFDHTRDEVIYHLQKHSDSGAPASAIADAQLRVDSLAGMRKSDEWTPDAQSNQSIGYVPNTGPFSRASLKGFT